MLKIRIPAYLFLAVVMSIGAWRTGAVSTSSAAVQNKAGVKGGAASRALAGSVHSDWREQPLEPAIEKGIRWLVSVQGEDGGWGQDGGRRSNFRQGVSLESSGNDVANTCMAALALLRSGTSPAGGMHREALNGAVDFVLRHIEQAPETGLAVTSAQGTQIQRKLGPFIDTFLSSMLLSELDGQMPDQASQRRVRAALQKCVRKIERHQMEDGSWNLGGGWAPVIGTSLASRGLYQAQAKGVPVQQRVLDKTAQYTEKSFDRTRGEFKAGDAGAGVELYQAAQALEQVSRTPESRAANSALGGAAVAKLSGANFVRGYGSMGGEEFVSYLNISDSLVRTGGKEWGEWNTTMKTRLVKLQNQDGTWAGHHCITGRVTCTSAAILTLLTERTVPRVT